VQAARKTQHLQVVGSVCGVAGAACLVTLVEVALSGLRTQTTCTAFLKNQARFCGRPEVEGKTKCRGHGGLSSGPKTDAGK
jgi:hypothetical protein